MSRRSGGLGRTGFVERHGLRDEDGRKAAEEVLARVEREGLEVVRLAFADQHGILRGKTLIASQLAGAMVNGCSMTTTLLAKDTAHRTVYPVFTSGGGFDMAEMTGGGDFLMIPDPSSFCVLPWAEATGWMLCDIYFPNGKPVPFSTRRILSETLGEAAGRGFDYVAGLEVEFHIFRLEDPKLRPEQAGQPAEPPDVSLVTHGFQYLTELRMDELDPVIALLRRNILALGLPLRSVEVEFGPSQCEFTLEAGLGMETADAMMLFRSAVKQVARRAGYHATFMCRPHLANLFSSGWHLHQSLVDRRTGANAFTPGAGEATISPLGRHFVGGLLRHAAAASVFTTPTINGYKRYQPFSLAPDRAVWSNDNRGAMIRVIGGADDPATRIENRIGEPAANPYLYLASQIVAGFDGIDHAMEPPAPSTEPYNAEAARLPKSLMEAVAALRADKLYAARFGRQFIDYMVTLKEAEISRFLAAVTDWEHREYFEIF